MLLCAFCRAPRFRSDKMETAAAGPGVKQIAHLCMERSSISSKAPDARSGPAQAQVSVTWTLRAWERIPEERGSDCAQIES